MTNTAKDTTTGAPALTWTRKNEWGSAGSTYRAEAGGWRYCVDAPKKGSWVLRGWGPDDEFLYRDGFTTMKAAKATAQDHQDELAAKMDQAVTALAQLPMVAAKVAQAMLTAVIPAMQSMVNGVRRGAWTGIHRPSGCVCPTPTHTMRCGHGARPKVVSA
jgi:hypothetical protein